VRAELHLKPAEVKSSVTVTAGAPETKDPAPSETVSEKTLREAPNVNERFESSLPLIPGVVRGPDGHINLKGTRNTQSGALVNSLPPLRRDTKLESFDSYTQFDMILTPKQTATASFAVYPQKLDFLGLNTFTPQPSTPDFHQRGFQAYVQHRYIIGAKGLLT